MCREPLGGADLIVPAKTTPGIFGEVDVVRRVGIDEVIRLQGELLKIAGA